MKLEPRPKPDWHGWNYYKPYFLCPKMFHLEKVLGVQSYEPTAPRQDWAHGWLAHAGVGQWLCDPSESPDGAIDRFFTVRPEIEIETVLKAKRTVEAYITKWSRRTTETIFAVEYERPPRDGLCGGIFDVVASYGGGAAIWDHKFYAKSLTQLFNMWSRDPQMLTYATIWSEEETAKFGPLKAIILDCCSTLGDMAFDRMVVDISQIENATGPDGWWRRALIDGITSVKALTLPYDPKNNTESWRSPSEYHLSKEEWEARKAPYWTRNPNACDVGYGCQYKDLCYGGPANLGRYQVRGKSVMESLNEAPWK